jgi:GNAT superfamily N-acetyltransferase
MLCLALESPASTVRERTHTFRLPIYIVDERENPMRPGGEEFRQLVDIPLPDPRMENLVVPTAGGSFRPFELSDYHEDIARVQLCDYVPDKVWTHFETARNLAPFSWFVYRFQSVAEMQALASLELALRERCRKEGIGTRMSLNQLLRHAASGKWVNAEGLSAYQELCWRQRQFLESTAIHFVDQRGRPPLADFDEYLQQLAWLLPRLRNEWAHGSTMLLGQSIRILKLCADLINQLFDETKGLMGPSDELILQRETKC